MKYDKFCKCITVLCKSHHNHVNGKTTSCEDNCSKTLSCTCFSKLSIKMSHVCVRMAQ